MEWALSVVNDSVSDTVNDTVVGSIPSYILQLHVQLHVNLHVATASDMMEIEKKYGEVSPIPDAGM